MTVRVLYLLIRRLEKYPKSRIDHKRRLEDGNIGNKIKRQFFFNIILLDFKNIRKCINIKIEIHVHVYWLINILERFAVKSSMECHATNLEPGRFQWVWNSVLKQRRRKLWIPSSTRVTEAQTNRLSLPYRNCCKNYTSESPRRNLRPVRRLWRHRNSS